MNNIVKKFKFLKILFFSGQKALYKEICYELMSIFSQKTGQFGDPNLAYVYDSRSTLFTSNRVSLIKVTQIQYIVYFTS